MDTEHFIKVCKSIRTQARVMLLIIGAMFALIIYLTATRTTVMIQPTSSLQGSGGLCINAKHRQPNTQNDYATYEIRTHH